MANVVGVLLIVLVVVGVPLKYLGTEGSDPQELGEWITKMMKGDHDQATSVLRNIGG